MSDTATNGAPVRVEHETTGDICRRVAAQAGESHSDLAAALESLLARASAPPPPPPPPDPKHIRKAKRANWYVQAVIGAIAACSAAGAVFLATEARSVSNEEAIKSHESLSAHPEAKEEMAKIKTSIGTVQRELSGEDGVSGIKGDIKAIASGVESLKQEARTKEKERLEDENEELKRSIRLLEGGR